MKWTEDGRDWPHREASRFVDAGGVRWHVQVMGDGPALLLVHGTGASTHSFRDLMPLLARRFTVVAPDLPGHAFTSTPTRMSVDAMGGSMAALLDALGLRPHVAVGHSAGAAVLVRMALDRRLSVRALVGLNAALMPLAGLMRAMSPMAKLLANAPGVPFLVTRYAHDQRAMQRLIDSTGSRIDTTGSALYARVVRDPDHVAGALAMMAAWNLDRTDAELPRLQPAPLLIVGGADRTVPPWQAGRVASRVPGTKVDVMTGLGHLAHEEEPERVAATIVAHATERGVLVPTVAS
jgi:putative magnesium chelatase accessory protein